MVYIFGRLPHRVHIGLHHDVCKQAQPGERSQDFVCAKGGALWSQRVLERSLGQKFRNQLATQSLEGGRIFAGKDGSCGMAACLRAG
jgi:hypothetical protein